VTIEARSADRWTSVLTTTAGANEIFSARLRVGQATALRARWQNDISLTWTTF
jgi:voltage-gated potassium channel Kch